MQDAVQYIQMMVRRCNEMGSPKLTAEWWTEPLNAIVVRISLRLSMSVSFGQPSFLSGCPCDCSSSQNFMISGSSVTCNIDMLGVAATSYAELRQNVLQALNVCQLCPKPSFMCGCDYRLVPVSRNLGR